jgi:hypothetical protein
MELEDEGCEGQPGPAAVAAGGATGSVPRVEDSSSPRETKVPRGMAGGGGVSEWAWRGMEVEAWRIGTVGRPHGAVKPRGMSAEWGRRASVGMWFF